MEDESSDLFMAVPIQFEGTMLVTGGNAGDIRGGGDRKTV